MSLKNASRAQTLSPVRASWFMAVSGHGVFLEKVSPHLSSNVPTRKVSFTYVSTLGTLC